MAPPVTPHYADVVSIPQGTQGMHRALHDTQQQTNKPGAAHENRHRTDTNPGPRPQKATLLLHPDHYRHRRLRRKPNGDATAILISGRLPGTGAEDAASDEGTSAP